MALLIGMTLAVSTAVSQSKPITVKDFYAYLTASRAATGDVPYRRKETVETSGKATGPWRLVGSSIQEAVPPDRFRTTFSSGQPADSIHIGTSFYTKQPDGTWVGALTEYRATASSPAALHGFHLPVVTFSETRGDDNAITVTVVEKPDGEAGNDATKARIYIYRFDRQGILVEKDSIGFNGNNWMKYTDRFEYDPKISIVAPRVN